MLPGDTSFVHDLERESLCGRPISLPEKLREHARFSSVACSIRLRKHDEVLCMSLATQACTCRVLYRLGRVSILAQTRLQGPQVSRGQHAPRWPIVDPAGFRSEGRWIAQTMATDHQSRGRRDVHQVGQMGSGPVHVCDRQGPAIEIHQESTSRERPRVPGFAGQTPSGMQQPVASPDARSRWASRRGVEESAEGTGGRQVHRRIISVPRPPGHQLRGALCAGDQNAGAVVSQAARDLDRTQRGQPELREGGLAEHDAWGRTLQTQKDAAQSWPVAQEKAQSPRRHSRPRTCRPIVACRVARGRRGTPSIASPWQG